MAESHFLRMAALKSAGSSYKIEHIDFVRNKGLEDAFEAKKAEFKNKKIPCHEVLAFHGTSPQNVDSILKKNLDPALHKRQAHGPGDEKTCILVFKGFINVSCILDSHVVV